MGPARAGPTTSSSPSALTLKLQPWLSVPFPAFPFPLPELPATSAVPPEDLSEADPAAGPDGCRYVQGYYFPFQVTFFPGSLQKE